MNAFRLIALASLVLALSCTSRQFSDAPAEMERRIDDILKKLTLEEKIGQMTALEVSLITATDTSFTTEKLAMLPEAKLDAVIRRFGLEKKYKAADMVLDLQHIDMDRAHKIYDLSLDIAARGDFHLDEIALDSLIGKYKVGCILNPPMMCAQKPELWNDLVRKIQEKSMQELGIPCVYALDQMHGTTYTDGGTLFPSAINLAATFNRDLARSMGEITAYETRACGVSWVYGPVMDLGRHQAWTRQYEGFGEDAFLAGEMGTAVVEGLQGTDKNRIDSYHVASTLKHFFAYGIPDNGLDRTPTTISEMELRERQFAPFLKGFRAGALTTMTNSSIVNGMNGVANRRFLTGWLKEDLEWDGVIITDWGDLENLRVRDHIASTKKEAVEMAVNAGVDMLMVPSEYTYGPLLKELVDEGKVSMERIDEAVRRVLRMKFRLGLFDVPVTQVKDYPELGSASFAAKSYQAALESEVLLKNEDGILPLRKGTRILVTGPNANSMRTLNGGWSYTWQGAGQERFTDRYHTIYEALSEKFGSSNVRLVEGVSYDFGASWDKEKEPCIADAVKAAAWADCIVACIGENSYAETTGNIADITLSRNQLDLVKALEATRKPVILILNEGRGRIIYDIVKGAKAIVHTMLPGNYGGDALADLLSGDENFSGKLPYTYSAHTNALVKYDYKACERREVMSGVYDYDAKTYQLWWFGEGLSYTEFAYSNLTVDKVEFSQDDVLHFSVDVTNTGGCAGKDVVMLFSSDLYASVMPDNRRLRAFEKIDLQPGQTRTVHFSLPASDLAFVNLDNHWMLEEGDFEMTVGDQTLLVRCARTYIWNTPNIPEQK